MAFVDLHLHTSCSDGSDTPEEVVARAVDAGATAIALTDHDTVAGVARGRTAAQDAGLEHVKELTNLDDLSLWGTKVTDAGLVHLKGLTGLRLLNLWKTQVTGEGVRKLQEALPDCYIGR